MDWQVAPPTRVTSPTWGPPPPCKQALKEGYVFTPPKRVTSPIWDPPPPCNQNLSMYRGALVSGFENILDYFNKLANNF